MLVPALLMLGAFACLVFGFRAWRRARAIDDTARSRVRSASQGYVELTGIATMPSEGAQHAPLSHSACLWWAYRIEQREGTSRDQRWRVIESGTSVAPLLLSDDSGSCLIYPVGAEVTARTRDTWYGQPGGLPVAPRFGEWFNPGAATRYVEERIVAGDTISVLGEFRTVGGAAGNLEAQVLERLQQWKRDQGALLKRFDANGDGRIEPEEWEAARAAARAEVLASQSAEAVSNVMERPGDGRPYLLAVATPAELARRYRWQAAALLLGFLALVGLSAHGWRR